jgi:hypothetical protein
VENVSKYLIIIYEFVFYLFAISTYQLLVILCILCLIEWHVNNVFGHLLCPYTNVANYNSVSD